MKLSWIVYNDFTELIYEDQLTVIRKPYSYALFKILKYIYNLHKYEHKVLNNSNFFISLNYYDDEHDLYTFDFRQFGLDVEELCCGDNYYKKLKHHRVLNKSLFPEKLGDVIGNAVFIDTNKETFKRYLSLDKYPIYKFLHDGCDTQVFKEILGIDKIEVSRATQYSMDVMPYVTINDECYAMKDLSDSFIYGIVVIATILNSKPGSAIFINHDLFYLNIDDLCKNNEVQVVSFC